MTNAGARRGSASPEADVRVTLGAPYDLARTLLVHLRGAGDPSMRVESSGAVWRSTRTSTGPATLFLQPQDRTGVVRVRAWGPGAETAVGGVAALLGDEDDASGLVPTHPVVGAAVRRFAGLRLGRSGSVFEALVPAILEQKITGDEARRTYRNLVRAYGEDAPGPPGLRLFPDPSVLAQLPYHAFHPLGLERRRSELVRAVAREAGRLERLGADAVAPTAERSVRQEALGRVYTALQSFPGIGPWTAAEVGLRAFGDPDAVSVGDFHVPNMVCWALAREPRGTDERMLELLEPYRGQRGRVVRLLELSGIMPPRHGPRMATRHIEGI